MATATMYDPAAARAASYAAENALAQRVLQLPSDYSGPTGVPFTSPILPLARLLSSSSTPRHAALADDLVALDHELQILFAVLLHRLVLPWHRLLTPERGLCQEAHSLVAQLATRIAERFPPLLKGPGSSWGQFHTFLVAELPSLLQTHWSTYRALPPPGRARLGDLDLLTRPHPGLYLSESSESMPSPLYIRTLVETLLHPLLEENEVHSDVALYLLRDILASALLAGLKGAHPRFWSAVLHSAFDALQTVLLQAIMAYRPRNKNRRLGIPGALTFLTSLVGWIALAGHFALWIMFVPIFVPSRCESSASMPGTFPPPKIQFPTTKRQPPQSPPSTLPLPPESGAALMAYLTAVDVVLDLRRTVLGSLISLLARVAMTFSASSVEIWILCQLQRAITLPQVTSLVRAIRIGALPMDLDDLPSGFPDPVRSPEVLEDTSRRRNWSTLPQHAADTFFSLIVFGVCVGHNYVPFHPLPAEFWIVAESYTATGGKAYSHPICKMEGNLKYIPPAAVKGPNWDPTPWLARLHQSAMRGARHALAPLCAPDAAPIDTRLALSLVERVAAILDPQLLYPSIKEGRKRSKKLSCSIELPSPPAGTLSLQKKGTKSRHPATPSSSPQLPGLQLQGRRVTPPITSIVEGKASTPQAQIESFIFPEPPVVYPHSVATATEGAESATPFNLPSSMPFPVPANQMEKDQPADGEEIRRTDVNRVPHLTRTLSGGILGLEGISESMPHSPAHSGTSNGTFGERAFRAGHFATPSLTALATPPIVASAAATANLSSTSLARSARKDLQRHTSVCLAPASNTPSKRLEISGGRSASPPAGLHPSSSAPKKHKSASSTFSLGFL